VAAIASLWRAPYPSTRMTATGLFALGFALSLIVEILYIRDVFDDRMNTLFKVYYQAWTLFAVASALACLVIWREARPRLAARLALASFMVLAIGAGLVYPWLSAKHWTGGFAGWDGLDGIAYVGATMPDELAAIRWLQANARPSDVVLEAAGCAYQPNGDVPFNRVAAYTGIPTVIGWDNHERQWRSGQPDLLAAIDQREADVGRMFAEPRGQLLDRYGITLLYVGHYEREEYGYMCQVAGAYPGVASDSYPGSGWEPVFLRGQVGIFRRQPNPA